MNEDANSRHTLPLESKRRIDRVCLEFEAAWKSGQRPQIEPHLRAIPAEERRALLRELLFLDLEYRSRAGEEPGAGEYHDRFPGERELIENVFRSLSESHNTANAGTRIRYFGDYELLEEIARGGMGVVYRARQLSLNRVVALKLVLAGQFASEEEVQRFRREAEAAANLQHPNIVAIHEVGQHEDQQYFSMAYVEGRTLARMVRENPLSAVQAARYVETVARAVEYAHQQGTLHRDLKPANILIDRDDQPRITDFGLARRVDADSDLTKSGQVLGSPSYMPPEQASGRLGEVGPRSDVYAPGAVLYDLVTGRPPFKAETPADTLLHVLRSEPVSPRALNPRVPRDLETICLKCLEKEPRRRYARASELAEELGRFLRGEPISARPISLATRSWRWCRRNPAVSALATGLIVAALVGFIGIAVQWSRAENEAERANLTAENEFRQRRKAEETADRNRRLLYVADMNVAQQAWEAGNVERVVELLERHRPKPDGDLEDLRGFQWHCLWRRCQRSLDTKTLSHGGPVWGIAFSPDGKTLASVAYNNPLRLWDVQTGLLKQELGDPGYGISVAFSSDGRTLVSGTSVERKVRVWNLTTGQTTSTMQVLALLFSTKFSPDGRLLAVTNGSTVQLRDVASGEPLRSNKKHKSAPIWEVAFSPDGKMVASTNNREVILWNLETEEQRLLEDELAGGQCVAFSADGKTLAAGGLGGKTWLWDVDSCQSKEPLQGQTRGAICSLAFSSDGRLAAGSSDGTVSLWDVDDRREYDLLKGHQGAVWDLAFSPDNHVLASGSWDGNVRLWDVTVHRPPDVLVGHRSDVSAVAFLPDGSAVVSGSADGTVRLWDVQTAEELAALPPHQDRIMAVAVSQDGRMLASGGWDPTIRLWDLATGQQKRPLGRWCNYCLAFSPNGMILVSCGASPSADVWDLAAGNRRYSTTDGFRFPNGHKNNVTAVAVSPNGKILATASWDKMVKLWDLATGTWLRTLQGHQGFVTCLAISPDGRTLASGSADNTVRLWDAATGQHGEILKAHSACVNSVAFSPDGAILASGSNDSTVKLWYLGKDREPESLAANATVTSVAFSPDGHTLAAAGGNTVKLWRTAGAEGSEELEALTSLARRARTITDADPKEQRQVIEDLKSHLVARAAEGLLQRDIILATSTVRRLEAGGQPELAAEVFQRLAEAIRGSKVLRVRELASIWEATAWEGRGRKGGEEGRNLLQDRPGVPGRLHVAGPVPGAGDKHPVGEGRPPLRPPRSGVKTQAAPPQVTEPPKREATLPDTSRPPKPVAPSDRHRGLREQGSGKRMGSGQAQAG
jgi:WD40 repeat protein/serine/threonine protein kinase